jgi:hypothetical protein
MMRIQMQVTKDHPIHNCREYSFTADGKVVGHIHRTGSKGSWHISVSRDSQKTYKQIDAATYRAPNYHAAVRLVACHLVGDHHRITYLQRGIWTNDGCPVPEKIL